MADYSRIAAAGSNGAQEGFAGDAGSAGPVEKTGQMGVRQGREERVRAILLSGFQEIDIHNMTRTQAITAIDARLRRVNASVYCLRVIHGYHGGTVLRDAVRTHYKRHPKVIRIEIGLNPGETDLILREL